MEFEIVWTIDWQKYELENNDMKFTEINFARAFVFEFVWKFYCAIDTTQRKEREN